MVYAVFQKLLKAPIGDPFFSVMGPVFFSQGTRFFQSGDPFFQVPDVKTGHLTTFWHPFLSIRETGLNWVVYTFQHFKKMGCKKNAIYRVMRLVDAGESVAQKEGQGRPRKLTKAQEKKVTY